VEIKEGKEQPASEGFWKKIGEALDAIF